MFKHQPLSMYSPFDTIHLLRHFFHCSKQFLNSSILMPFSAAALFCFTSSTSAKRFPLRTLFFRGNKKSRSGQDQVNKECRAWASHHFWSKTAEQPWLVWLSGLSTSPWTKGSPVRFPFMAHAWVVGQFPSGDGWEATTHWCFSPSLFPSLPPVLKMNK